MCLASILLPCLTVCGVGRSLGMTGRKGPGTACSQSRAPGAGSSRQPGVLGAEYFRALSSTCGY